MSETAPASTFGMGVAVWGTQVRGGDVDRLYDTFRQAGQNHFDTAHIYAAWLEGGLGSSERALGEIVRRRGDRANVLLATKGGHPAFGTAYPRPERFVAPAVIAQDITESLDRLAVESIDLYYLHRDDPRVPVGEIVDMLNEHVKRGQVREIGASNWPTARLAAANEYAAKRSLRGFVAHQVKFSLAVANPSKDPTVPTFDDAEIAWHAKTKLPIHAYSSTANGFFATGGVKGASGWSNPASQARLKQAQRLAGELKATANQVALAWLLHQRMKVVPLLGTSNVEHLRDALAAREIRLGEAQMLALSVGA